MSQKPSATSSAVRRILASPYGQAYAIIWALMIVMTAERLLLGNSDAFLWAVYATIGGTLLGLTAWVLFPSRATGTAR